MFVRDAILRIAAGFQFDFEERVDIFFKQCIGLLRKMPYFVHLDDLIAFLERFHQLDTASRPFYGSFGIGMGRRGLVTGIGARSAESEHHLVLTMVRENGMEQTARW